MTSEPMADVRDMYMAHTMFRREFGLAPALIRGVAAGDAGRAQILTEHLDFVLTILEHHRGEDEHLWPRLLERAGADAKPVAQTMESQHAGIEEVVGRLHIRMSGWRGVVSPEDGAGLAEDAELLSVLLDEHLQTEEKQALPMIEQYVTAAEWGQMVAEGAVGIAPEQMPLIFGLMAYEGDAQTVADVIATMPAEIAAVIGDLAAQTYAEYALRVHGTATPARIGSRED